MARAWSLPAALFLQTFDTLSSFSTLSGPACPSSHCSLSRRLFSHLIRSGSHLPVFCSLSRARAYHLPCWHCWNRRGPILQAPWDWDPAQRGHGPAIHTSRTHTTHPHYTSTYRRSIGDDCFSSRDDDPRTWAASKRPPGDPLVICCPAIHGRLLSD
ncbi:hypothetical protein F5X68DRAFT_40916 [Plectosphaerella plurivora]|uniref:Secreted protein n=1 Tax=Plectosphaerella plurivora TaxID=936078 RepID=A0A9P8V4L4_9PEZI|nr:hypothetical protein F5X68DRAFT_40916 [Plectosphaerella plurivora]